MFGLNDLTGLPTLKDLAGLGPLPPQEEVLPLEDSKTEKDETVSGEEGTNSEGMGEKDELAGETSKDLG
jgi:hypothetical protein